jgi:hypothetical protein
MPSKYEPTTRLKYQKPPGKQDRQVNMRVDDDTFDLLIQVKELRGYQGRTLAPFVRQLLMETLQQYKQQSILKTKI